MLRTQLGPWYPSKKKKEKLGPRFFVGAMASAQSGIWAHRPRAKKSRDLILLVDRAATTHRQLAGDVNEHRDRALLTCVLMRVECSFSLSLSPDHASERDAYWCTFSLIHYFIVRMQG